MKPIDQAKLFKQLCQAYGWEYTITGIRNDIVRITKEISNEEEFVKADGEYHSILSAIKMTSPGSTWGTDGGGIGALSAMKHGLFVMKKSGCDKRVIRLLTAG